MGSSFGGTIKLQGESEYRRALSNIASNLRVLNSEMRVVSTSYDRNDKSVANLTQQSDILNRKIEEQRSKVSTLSEALERSKAETGENSATTKKWQVELNNAKAELNNMENKLQSTTDALGKATKEEEQGQSAYKALTLQIVEQRTKLGDLQEAYASAVLEHGKNSKSAKELAKDIKNLDGELKENEDKLGKAEKATNELGKETETSGKKAEKAKEGFTVFKGVLANLSTQAINSAINGIKRLGSSLFSMGKQAVNSYAEYEQLLGGVETLYGSAAETVAKNAANAYKTAGLSMNEYMEQATSFAAALKQSTKTQEEAAQVADIAIQDMADNANKMGTSMESIQNAYNGFAKANYTMLKGYLAA